MTGGGKGRRTCFLPLREAGATRLWSAHLREHLVQPLKRAVQVCLHPARRRGDGLSSVVGAPALHERHPNGAHSRECVGRLEALLDGGVQQRRKLSHAEDLQVAV